MGSPHERSRNNLRAGIFVTVAILLGVATIIVLTDVTETLLRPTNDYTVSFEVEDGVKNLKAGAQVRVGGVSMGTVERVRPIVGGDAPFSRIEVDFSLDRDVVLYRDASIVISSQLIGSDAWLDIYSVGSGGEAVAAGDVLTGISAPGALTALLGPTMVADAGEIVADFKATSEDIRELAARVNDDDWPRWAASVDRVMEWAATAPEKIDGVLDEGRGMFAGAREVVDENREPFRETVENARAGSEKLDEIMARVRDETVEKVNTLLDSGREGVDKAVVVLESLAEDYPQWSTDVGEALAGARLTAQQLKLASIEVRRSPWKLLYRPSRGEVEHELLYEAARSFALAGSDLKATSESAQRILDGYGDELDRQMVERINEFLTDSLSRYNSAQERLMDVLVSGN